MVYKRTRAGSRFARDKSPLANRRTGIPLKSTVYEGQLGSASIRWILHRTKSEGGCIHCNKTIPKNSRAAQNSSLDKKKITTLKRKFSSNLLAVVICKFFSLISLIQTPFLFIETK